jgi:hypothetical protein
VRYDRDVFLRALGARLDRAGTAYGGIDRSVVFGRDADAELRGLLRTADARTDMEARHAAGWLCAARAMADPEAGGRVHGSMAGTLLFPVWVADPQSVPPGLAAGYASADPASRPDPAAADGPNEWAAQCAAVGLAARGEHHDPPADAPEDVRRLHELAAAMVAMTASREALLATGIGCGSLAVLATPEHDLRFADRLGDVSGVVAHAGIAWPFGDLADADPVRFTHRAVKALPADSPERLLTLIGLSRRLLLRHLDTYEADDLHAAVGIARDVRAQLPPGSPHLAVCLSTLANGLLVLRQVEGATPEECDEVVDVCRLAVSGHPRGAAEAGHDLGMALVLRYQRTGRAEDLHEAIAVFTRALRAAADPGEKAALRNALGNALRARHVATGDPADLDEALRLTAPSGTAAETGAVRISPSSLPRWPSTTTTCALRRRTGRTWTRRCGGYGTPGP